MQASKRSTEAEKVIEIIELRGMPPAAGEDGDPVALGLVQGLAINGYWCDDRQVVIDQLPCESVFFKDL